MRRVMITVLAVLLMPIAPLIPIPQQIDTGSPFVYRGVLYVSYPATFLTRPLGRLSPSAPSVIRGPNGLYWGRVDPNYLGGLDASTGAVVARIPLSFRAYRVLRGPGAKAYVFHNTLTSRGFTVSIVDLAHRSRIGELSGIRGLRTGVTEGDGRIFVTAQGVGRDDRFDMYLYEIDMATDTLREIRHQPAKGYFWQAVYQSGVIYLLSLPRRTHPGRPFLELLSPSDPRGRRVELPDALCEGADTLRLVTVHNGIYLFLRKGREGRFDLVRVDRATDHVLAVQSLRGIVSTIVYVQENMLVYIDRDSEAGVSHASLCYYNLREGKEVKRFDLSR